MRNCCSTQSEPVTISGSSQIRYCRLRISALVSIADIFLRAHSGYTFLSRDQLKKLNLKVPISPASIEFHSYSRDAFVPYGKIISEEEVYIVTEEYSALLGRIWIPLFNIDLSTIDQDQGSSSRGRSIRSV